MFISPISLGKEIPVCKMWLFFRNDCEFRRGIVVCIHDKSSPYISGGFLVAE